MNIYDIAQEAGVSIATISRVVNNKGQVSAATRAKVEAVLAQHNYTPSAIAQGLMNKSLRTVAVLTVDIRVPHYARTAYTIEREFSRRGYEVMLCNAGGDREETLRYLRAVTRKQVDGIVLVGSVFNTICQGKEMESLLANIPVVLANGKLDLPNTYSVSVDDRYGIALAVEHLVKRGRKNIFYVKDKDTVSAKNKLAGFEEALAHQNLEVKGRVLEVGSTLEDGITAGEKILASGCPCDAIVCGEDLTAAGVLKALLRAGIQVPKQIAVTGFNSSDYARLCEPVLTSVDNKPEQVAMLCVQLLEGRIEQNGMFSSVTVQPELCLGQTS